MSARVLAPLTMIVVCSFTGAWACGRLGFDASTEQPPDADAAGVDARNELGKFGAAEPIPGIQSSEAKDDPSLTNDELLIVFQQSGDIWFSERPDPTAAFATPTILTEVSMFGDAETTPELTGDGLGLFFGRSVGGGRSVDIFFSSRASRTADFAEPVLVAELSSTRWEAAATPSTDPNRMLFARDLVGDSSNQLFLATRADANSPWTELELGAPINGDAVDTSPFISSSGTLYFTTTRSGADREIWRAEPQGSTWVKPVALPELQGAFKVTDPWLSPDERRLYYVSDESGTDEILVRTR